MGGVAAFTAAVIVDEVSHRWMISQISSHALCAAGAAKGLAVCMSPAAGHWLLR